MAKDGRGWHREKVRHGLAARGIKTVSMRAPDISPRDEQIMAMLTLEQRERLQAELAKQVDKAKADNPQVEEQALRYWPQVAPTGRSEGRPVRTSKPKDDGRAAYIWRMLRFHLGEDVHIPVMAEFDLDQQIDKETGYRRSDATEEQRSRQFDLYREEQKKADAIVEYILATKFPLRQFRAAMRYKGIL